VLKEAKMHGPTPPPEHIKTLRALLAIAKGNPELEAAVEAFALALHKHALEIGCETGYAEGLRQGRIRGRRRAKGLPEIAKRGSLARRLKELGFSLDDIPEPPPFPRHARR
jgi:hypothetical protein